MKVWTLVGAVALGLVSMQGCASESKQAKHDKVEASEVKVKLEDCPAAVQQTIKKEVGAGKIEDIARETEDGKATYETDATIDGKDYEIKVAADGKLISKKIEDQDKNEKDEKDNGKK